jgi:LmbE family N-acetylglucosaminyl deacetylase
MKVLVLAAHADDEILGVGGTIAKHIANGDEVYVQIMIGKQSSALAERERKSDKPRYDDTVLQRRREQSGKVASLLGIKEVRFMGLEDETLEQQLTKTIEAIEDYYMEIKPDIVYTHHGGDSNQDHRGVFKASIVAVRTITDHPPKKVLCYEVPSSTEQAPPSQHYAFVPNYFVDIAGTLQKKLEAMKIYHDETGKYPHPRSLKALEVLAKHRGIASGCHAAEAFMLFREVA